MILQDDSRLTFSSPFSYHSYLPFSFTLFISLVHSAGFSFSIFPDFLFPFYFVVIKQQQQQQQQGNHAGMKSYSSKWTGVVYTVQWWKRSYCFNSTIWSKEKTTYEQKTPVHYYEVWVSNNLYSHAVSQWSQKLLLHISCRKGLKVFFLFKYHP